MPETNRPQESCPACGFSWDEVSLAEVGPRVSGAVDGFLGEVTEAGPACAMRPTEGRWSTLEYASHLRDVLISIRERVILASVLDNPIGMPMYREERVDLGFYALDTPEAVAGELDAVRRLFIRTINSLPPGYEDRPLVYSTITPVQRTVLWASAQAVHECEHHLGDIRENAERPPF